MIPYGKQTITEEDILAVTKILRSNFLTQGPTLPLFEQAVSEHVGSKYGVAVNSASSALHIACLALNVGQGDIVWTSPNSFVASANCALHCGAQIDFVDIDPKTYNMSIEALEEKLRGAETLGTLPKVVIPVHYAGQPCDMASIENLSKRYNFKIIEDASHAIGAHYFDYRINRASSKSHTKSPKVQVGACVHSDITVFSFHPVKIITTGEGGIAMTNDSNLAERMSRLRSHGITRIFDQTHNNPDNEIWNYQQDELGFNYRMTDLQAALGLSQLTRLKDFVSKRHEIANIYNSAFHDVPIINPWQHPNSYSSYHLYPICIDTNFCRRSQKEIFTFLQNNGISVNLHYIPIHRHPLYKNLGFRVGDYPEAESFFRRTITLPIYPTLSKLDQNQVIKSVREATL
ncbi:UDP-4-amino-4,6-dideoxy-N-acetyl-beta-L-altrosamine transaminase [Gammaproteobacteria bacterium]|nr:UDP-4-amino-4,6-dideoxy-N-acetyl-beta-L-altrosamine transaminase [Gammaproteobacteria bacterium]MDC3279243.1 UDP-4-amino-4,6-dideoxy-N-acetyl-beta-L-altrosamine transaminase [Gammaproteobacteria bacterium]